MTEEIYNKATNLRSLIEKDKKALKEDTYYLEIKRISV